MGLRQCFNARVNGLEHWLVRNMCTPHWECARGRGDEVLSTLLQTGLKTWYRISMLPQYTGVGPGHERGLGSQNAYLGAAP